MIFSGCKNEAKLGIFAGSASSYQSFNKFYSKVIKEYHGVEEHPREAKLESVTFDSFSDEEAKMIV